MMKHRIIHIIFLFLLLVFNPYSCGNEYPFATETDCNDCYTDKPSSGTISIKLSEDKIKDGVIVKVYKGKFTEEMALNDSQVYFDDTIHKASVDVDVPLDQYYSVLAQYKVNGIKYNVVDGDNIKLYSIKSTCNFDCWIIKGGQINCMLKF